MRPTLLKLFWFSSLEVTALTEIIQSNIYEDQGKDINNVKAIPFYRLVIHNT